MKQKKLTTVREAPPADRSPDPITVRIPDAVKLTGITKTRFYELFKSGEIMPIKVGSTTLISYEALKAFIAKIEKDQRS